MRQYGRYRQQQNICVGWWRPKYSLVWSMKQKKNLKISPTLSLISTYQVLHILLLVSFLGFAASTSSTAMLWYVAFTAICWHGMRMETHLICISFCSFFWWTFTRFAQMETRLFGGSGGSEQNSVSHMMIAFVTILWSWPISEGKPLKFVSEVLFVSWKHFPESTSKTRLLVEIPSLK